jgi:lipoic acid synthetase
LEPDNIAKSVHALGLQYVVLTSVTRDDLDDNGSSHYYQTIQSIKEKNPSCKVETLIPDFKGSKQDLQMVLSAEPNVLNHNIEVVQNLFSSIRPQGDYHRSLDLLSASKQQYPHIPTKSGFMIGLGESWNDILILMDDLRKADVDFLTIGQYLQPTKDHVTIKKYYTPDEFDKLKDIAKEKGFSFVASGPLVRSSYNAQKALNPQ